MSKWITGEELLLVIVEQFRREMRYYKARIEAERWIAANLEASKHSTRSSYSWKHEFEFDTGLYIPERKFRDALLRCGVEVDADDLVFARSKC